ADDAGQRVDADAVGQAGGGVGQRIAVGIGGSGVEAGADDVALGVGLVSQVGAEHRRLVGAAHRPGEAVGVNGGRVADGDADVVDPAAGEAQGAADDAGQR